MVEGWCEVLVHIANQRLKLCAERPADVSSGLSGRLLGDLVSLGQGGQQLVGSGGNTCLHTAVMAAVVAEACAAEAKSEL